ncbi:MAG TPA: hypothetical protein VJ995_02630 [Geothermobacteraceae bacterium]|nr:hypothetical protein [Geothermobacteraceae bacterium]
MRQFVEQLTRYVADFLSTIEEDLKDENNPGITGNIQTILKGFLQDDLNFMAEKLSSAFPERAGLPLLENVIEEGRSTIKDLYNNLSLQVSGTLVEY